MEGYKKKVEAVLFASGKFLEVNKIGEMLNLGSVGIIKGAIEELKEEYRKKDSAIEILEQGGSYRMHIKPDFIPFVKGLMTETEFDRPTISTLAIIAWKQPILQSKIVKIRGNTAYDHLKFLEEKEFIMRKPHGLTKVVKLTPKFYEYFDTNQQELAKAMPKIESDETVALAIKQMFGS
ncbi:SMC-Scp complex subunit ScpB [Candidatus Woesearchaeota archaeon]|nr:SMC-Scp complex subunit ScpB [Candidatus Woesearchaeota archaeon]